MLKLVLKPDDPLSFRAPEQILLGALTCHERGSNKSLQNEIGGGTNASGTGAAQLLDDAEFERATGKKVRLVLGRGSVTCRVDIELNARRDGKEVISRQHADIVVDVNGRHIIQDLGSLNGLFVNNLRIDNHALKEGDVVQFGGVAKVPVGHLIKSSDVCLKYVYVSNSNREMVARSGLGNQFASPSANFNNNENNGNGNGNGNTSVGRPTYLKSEDTKGDDLVGFTVGVVADE